MELVFEDGHIDYHIRLKGVSGECIRELAKEKNMNLIDLYLKMRTEPITYNLANGRVCMKKDNTG